MDAVLTGTLKVSSSSNVVQQAISLSAFCSTFVQEQYVVSIGIASAVISFAAVSNPRAVFLMATDTLLACFRGTAPAAMSAGDSVYIKDFVGFLNSGGTGMSGLRVGNSGSTSATLTVWLGM